MSSGVLAGPRKPLLYPLSYGGSPPTIALASGDHALLGSGSRSPDAAVLGVDSVALAHGVTVLPASRIQIVVPRHEEDDVRASAVLARLHGAKRRLAVVVRAPAAAGKGIM